MAETKPAINKTLQHKKKLIQAMTASLGIISHACKKAKISRVTFYEYYNNDPEFKQSIDDIENIALDFVESALYQQIKNENTTATIFYLKTKGRKRGYQESIDMTTNGKDIVPTIIKWGDSEIKV